MTAKHNQVLAARWMGARVSWTNQHGETVRGTVVEIHGCSYGSFAIGVRADHLPDATLVFSSRDINLERNH